jgi:cell division protein FtsB
MMRPPLAKIGLALVILLAVGYALFALRGPQGLAGLTEKRREIQELEKRNATLAREIESKRERINRLRESPSLQDLEIRRQLKYVHPDEKVYILQDSHK